MMVNGAAQPWQANTLFNLPSSTAGAKNNAGAGAAGGRRDSVSFSQAGRQQQQVLGALAEKKDAVIKQKNALIAQTLEAGMELNVIEEQLDGFEEQLDMIDEQIASMMAGQTSDAIDSMNPEEKTKESDAFGNTPLQEEEETDAAAEAAGYLSDISSRMELSQKAASVSRQFEGRANVLKQQIKMDADRNRVQNPSPGDNAASREYSSKKSVKLAHARRQAAHAYGQAAKLAGSVSEKVSAKKDDTPLAEMSSQAMESKQEQDAQKQAGISEAGGLNTVA